MGEKIEKVGELQFWLSDYREDKFNESVNCTFDIWKDKEDEILSIGEYWYYCRRFAAAMGFSEIVIDEWFGE